MVRTGQPAQVTPSRAGCLHTATAALVAAGELIVLAACFGVMFLGLKTNGQVFTEALESTRRETWLLASLVALVTSGAASVYFSFHAIARKSFLLLAAQLLIMVLVIAAVVHLHGAIPVPPGTQTGGVGP